MKSFKDANGITWDIKVTVGVAETVKDLTSVNLFDLYGAEANRVFADPINLVNVLYAACKTQCDERKITDIHFGESMFGDALEEGATALLEALADFFPQRRKATMLTMLAKSQAAAKILETEAAEKIEALEVTALLSSMKLQASSR
jgi:hypothetical protein